MSREDILVNIITRTHDRPDHFKVCRDSILNQTHKNINHIVGSDVECNYHDGHIKLPQQKTVHPKPDNIASYEAPWNLHCNELGKYVKDGWVMYLDDDDKFIQPEALKIILNFIDDEDQMILWRVDINGTICPDDSCYGKIIPGNISSIGFMFHSKHLPVDWGSWNFGDYRAIVQLSKKVSQRWINTVLTQTQGKPNFGGSPDPIISANKKVSIITRAYNRLEYTIQNIISVEKNTSYNNYEHIIMNNNSNDGTKEWLNWISKSGISQFNKVKPVHSSVNLGDWGGMLEAHKYVDDDSEYYVQLDNDISIIDPEWINKMIFILENTEHNIIQLKRLGVQSTLTPTNTKTIKYGNEELEYGHINRPVACFMLKTKDFKRLYPELKNNTVLLPPNDGKSLLSKKLGGTGKIVNVPCQLIDGFDGSSYVNYEKYPPKLKINNVNIIHENR